jgi:phosphoenolpyruvate-protein phosphotransferase (PTS system enzyme I)
MKTLKGISAAPGIAIGKVYVYLDDAIRVPKYTISPDDVAYERDRFDQAATRAVDELERLKHTSTSEMGEERSGFLDSHILMVRDPEFQTQVFDRLDSELKNVEWILLQVIEELVERLDGSSDAYLRERTLDIHDVSRRVLNHLLFRERISLADLSDEVILVTHNLLPSDALSMNKSMVKGIAMDEGGKTSHTAILARAFEIPAVLGLSDITAYISTGDDIIVDGNTGVVVLKPDAETSARYSVTSREWHEREIGLLTLNTLPAETTDGKLIRLMANIEVPEETDSVKAHGADGIGLYRSEFLFLKPGGLATEEEQYRAYSSVLESMGDLTVTIRTLDLGGDKISPAMQPVSERNPILGWRAIRYCLSQRPMFLGQLRALLRASVHGNLQIMFPMISGVEELDAAFEALDEARGSLDGEGIKYADSIPIGIMIETPSAALTSDILARKVDFFSIGTNDLIQYTIAVDRGNERIAYLYEPFHPGVLRLIKLIIDQAHQAGIPVSMCGEMAGDPLATVMLLGLGLDAYSMSAFTIPEIKQIIRSVSVREAKELVETVSDMGSVRDIDQFVQQWTHDRFES